jgi:two-component system phosphate regulon sensor histidine kinase PhoR
VRIESVLLSDVAREVARELSAVAEEKNMTIRTETPEEISPIMIDRDLTKQCIINLVENAIKYNQTGNNVIILLTEETGQMRTGVVDHGIGIGESEVDMVFEKFYRAYSGDDRSVPGSGLGLTFVRGSRGCPGRESVGREQVRRGINIFYPVSKKNMQGSP